MICWFIANDARGTHCKKKKQKEKGCRYHSSLVPKCGTNVLLFHCIDKHTTIAMATLRCPFHWLLVGASSSTASSHLIRIQFSPFSDFYEPINGTRGFLCDSLSPLIVVFLSLLLCLFYCMFVCLFCCTFNAIQQFTFINNNAIQPSPLPPR